MRCDSFYVFVLSVQYTQYKCKFCPVHVIRDKEKNVSGKMIRGFRGTVQFPVKNTLRILLFSFFLFSLPSVVNASGFGSPFFSLFLCWPQR
jgi:hypothetical protein